MEFKSNSVAVSADKTLTLNVRDLGSIKGVAGVFDLSGGGTLRLEAPVSTANDLTITDGSTLVFAEKGALSDVANNLTIGKGSIVVEADVEDDVFPAMNANSMKLEVGNLTIDRKSTRLNPVTDQSRMPSSA